VCTAKQLNKLNKLNRDEELINARTTATPPSKAKMDICAACRLFDGMQINTIFRSASRINPKMVDFDGI
jgi:hypothetical protein